MEQDVITPDAGKAPVGDEIQQKLQAALKEGGPLPDIVEPEQKPVTGSVSPAAPETTGQPTVVYTPAPYWGKVKQLYEEQFGKDSFKIPENINAENDTEEFINFLTQNINAGSESQLHPLAGEIMSVAASKGDQFNAYEWIKEKYDEMGVMNMSNDDFLFNYLQKENGKTDTNPEGWTDDDIKAEIQNMTKIQRDQQAKKLKETYKQSIEKKYSEAYKPDPEVLRKQIADRTEAERKVTDMLFTKTKTWKTIGGIPLSEKDVDSFRPVFDKLMEYDEHTGMKGVHKLLSNNETLFKAMYLLHRADGDLSNFITQLREGTKQSVLNALELTPEVKGGQIAMPSGFDSKKLV